MRTLDLQRLSTLSRMELVARQTVEGFLAGKHPSPFHGSSVEYADHRPYAPGDELKSLDWKLLAKTDKYYVKLFEAQTNLRATLVLDTSRSMAFAGRERMAKLDYAAHLAAALGYLLLRQNDAVGLALVDQTLRHYLPARSTPSHFRRMVAWLEEKPPDHPSRMAPVLHELAGRIGRRGLVILFSDLLDDTGALFRALDHFRHRKHEVLVFHVLDPDELSFPYERLTRFEDMEGAGQVVAHPQRVRRTYLEQLEAFLETVRLGCLERGVGYQRVRTDTPWDEAISRFLEQRARTKGH